MQFVAHVIVFTTLKVLYLFLLLLFSFIYIYSGGVLQVICW